MHVASTTDPAKDLTQTTAQAVTPDSADVAVAVTQAADTTGGGGDNGGGNVTPPTTGPSTGGGGADTVKPGKEPATTPNHQLRRLHLIRSQQRLRPRVAKQPLLRPVVKVLRCNS